MLTAQQAAKSWAKGTLQLFPSFLEVNFSSCLGLKNQKTLTFFYAFLVFLLVLNILHFQQLIYILLSFTALTHR